MQGAMMATTGPEATPKAAGAKLPNGAIYSLVLLIVINMCNYIDRQNLAAVELLIENEPGFFAKGDPYVKSKMGLLPFAFMGTYMLMAQLFGWLGDRHSRWMIIAVGIALWSLATFGCGFATGFAMLFVLRCLVGVGEAAYGPAAPSIIADYFAVQRRGQALSWFYAAIPVGSALGYVLGGVIAGYEHWPWASGWRWVFFLMGPPGLILAAWCLFMRDPPRGLSDRDGQEQSDQESAPARLGFWSEYRLILGTKSYLINTLGMTAMTFALGGVAFWMPRYVAQFRDAGNLATVNLVFGGITVVAGLSSTLIGGWLGDRMRPKLSGSYFWVSGVAMLLGFVFFLGVLVIPFPFAWFLVFGSAFLLFFNTGPTNTIIANVIHPRMRAAAVALNIFVIHAFGDAISPAIIGLVADLRPGAEGDASLLVGLNAGFLVVSFMILVSGLLWCWGARYLERDTELAKTMLDPAKG
jgi:MFS family permease